MIDVAGYSTPTPHNKVYHLVTLWHLSGERRRDGDKVEVPRAVVNRHLFTLALVLTVAVTLIHEAVEWKSTPN